MRRSIALLTLLAALVVTGTAAAGFLLSIVAYSLATSVLP
jgi:hypothetical protein